MALRNLDTAYQRFFREKKGFPRFKSKKDNRQRFSVPQHSRVDFAGVLLFIPKFKAEHDRDVLAARNILKYWFQKQ